MNENVEKSPADLFARIRDYQLADWTYECLVKTINEFEAELNDDEISALTVAMFSNKPIIVDSIGFKNPNIIVFYGHFENGSKVDLVVYQSQLNLCLIPVKRQDTSVPRRKIGFVPDTSSPQDSV
ncbi:MAG: hypothetical protein KIB08_06880 [Negativicoccus succinicivorans]|uniref:DUF6173 family protein n=1 Tax=Negativicoccus succinicivorans TaxID=620903 RepID=UPI0026EB12A7|nr:DUF6173 family protein [Negativicoccus succinicivorans]MBS5888211.1 hypothetical protein [Negativicoccus succinicivorans]